MGIHQDIDWEKVIPEAYIVLNPASSVGKVTKAVSTFDRS